jgi:hypothetical protein
MERHVALLVKTSDLRRLFGLRWSDNVTLKLKQALRKKEDLNIVVFELMPECHTMKELPDLFNRGKERYYSFENIVIPLWVRVPAEALPALDLKSLLRGFHKPEEVVDGFTGSDVKD